MEIAQFMRIKDLIGYAVDEVVDEKKALAEKMGQDNNPINPNDAFFNSLKQDLKTRITTALNHA